MKRFALIMIDMQRGFLDPASPLCIPSAAATVPACAAAMDASSTRSGSIRRRTASAIWRKNSP